MDVAAIRRKLCEPRAALLRSQLVLDGRHATLLPIATRSLSALEVQEASRIDDSDDLPNRQQFRDFRLRFLHRQRISSFVLIRAEPSEGSSDNLHDNAQPNRLVDDGNSRRLHHAHD